MYEFGNFVYLDVQKTGSTFVRRVLKEFCTERELRYKPHAGIGDDYSPDKTYFISIRNPLDQYISLYSYGCGGEGALLARMRKRGFDECYDGTWQGFRSWLKFVLDVRNARWLGEGYGDRDMKDVRRIIGYQSFRVLSLCLRSARKALATCKTMDDVRAVFKSHNVAGRVLRQEHLREELAQFLSTELAGCIPNMKSALKFLEDAPNANESDRVDQYEQNAKLGKKLEMRLMEREWPMYELFGYTSIDGGH